ncbi:PREDICTED: beta-1,3-glucan-binding protein-like [Papilio polytes]|uniref:beta-1,3-glucan-binding protein-like n=1 Tax=Papilio polytes TaxID=76194 RepID=UPI000676573D|nr:PREDICTED: beta-1,3-glucan-binding protein-like [Papilio polytes]
MAVTSVLLILVYLFYCDARLPLQDYIVPEVKLEALYPRGLRISIPDDGYTQFSFHGNLNIKMHGIDMGTVWQIDNVNYENGIWTHTDWVTQLQLGDKIYYWVLVKKNNMRYVQSNREWTVTEFTQLNESSVESTPVSFTTGRTKLSETTAATTCKQSPTAVLGRTSICKGDLLFSEEFVDENISQLSNWTTEVMFPQGPNVGPQNKREINLEPRDNAYGNTNYGSGLIRIAFAKGNVVYAKKLSGGPIMYNLEPYRSFHLKKKDGLNNWNNDFHNYSLVWKPDGMEFYVDGEMYGTVDPGQGFHISASQNGVTHASHWTQGTVMAPLDTMFYVSFGLRVGGINDFEDVYFKPWKNGARKAMLNFWLAKNYWIETWSNADLKIDYVRVYAL